MSGRGLCQVLEKPSEFRSVQSLRTNAAAVLELAGGPLLGLPVLLHWLHRREELGLASTPEEAEEAAEIESLAWGRASVKTNMPKMNELFRERHAREAAAAERQQQELRDRCAEREAQRRSFKPESPRTPVAAPAASRHNGSVPMGELGLQMEARLDRVLSDLNAREDPSTWEEPEFPYELAIATLEAVQAEGRVSPIEELLEPAVVQPVPSTTPAAYRASDRPGLGLAADPVPPSQSAWDEIAAEDPELERRLELLALVTPLREALKDAPPDGAIQISAADGRALARMVLQAI